MSIYAAITFPLLAVTSRFEECARGLTGTVAELRDYAFCYGYLTTFKTGITGTYFKTTYWHMIYYKKQEPLCLGVKMCQSYPILLQCTMQLSPLKSCIKEFWLNASLSPHFPSV